MQLVSFDPRYLDWSRYGYQLDLFLEHFEREQLLVVHSDALRTEREATVAQVLEFIGVVPDTRSMNLDRELNQTREKRRAGPALQQGGTGEEVVGDAIASVEASGRVAGRARDDRAQAIGGVVVVSEQHAVARTAGLLAVALLPVVTGLEGDGFSDPAELEPAFRTVMLPW